ncbi:MAG: NAD(P)/FAD-dependent oxidoreductase [Saprospiraceae bacterium]
MEIFDCIIIGGGAAGYMAAITVAETKFRSKSFDFGVTW